MKKIILILFSMVVIINAQGITMTLGGNTADDKFIVENNNSEAGLVVTGEGNVGIGTTNPQFNLHISDYSSIITQNPTKFGISNLFGGPDPTILYSNWFNISVGTASSNFIRKSGTDLHFSTQGDMLATPDTTQMLLTGSGNLGIGTTDPYQKLEVKSSDKTKDAAARFLNDNGTILDIGVSGSNSGSGAGNDNTYMYTNNKDLIILSGTGNVGINTVNPQEKLDVIGTTRTMILEITGGGDLAEPFDIVGSVNIKPGMVVAIDSKLSGQLRIADRAYDRTVAGIVSGANGINPGMTMSQKGTVADGAFPVALTGRVYAWADASNSPIKPGDLLTTSDTPGHAMKVEDYTKAQGAIIGKAMSSLKQGQGFVLVLVALQ